MAVDSVRNRRLFKTEGVLGALMFVSGIAGGLLGAWLEYLAAACGAGLVVLSALLLRRYPPAENEVSQEVTSATGEE